MAKFQRMQIKTALLTTSPSASGIRRDWRARSLSASRRSSRRVRPYSAKPSLYPAGKPKLSGAILTLQPGAETGWHTHGAPPTGIVLDGELTVDYGDKGKRTYKKGDALVETMTTPHNGKNSGDGPMRLFVVFVGAEGVANTTKIEKP